MQYNLSHMYTTIWINLMPNKTAKLPKNFAVTYISTEKYLKSTCNTQNHAITLIIKIYFAVHKCHVIHLNNSRTHGIY